MKTVYEKVDNNKYKKRHCLDVDDMLAGFTAGSIVFVIVLCIIFECLGV